MSIELGEQVSHFRGTRFAYEHLNLRFNPFGQLDCESRAQLAVVGVTVRDGEILQFIGHSGRGKTTHLLALSHRLRGAHYELVAEGSNDYRSDPRTIRYLFIDEAQRIRARRLKQLMRRAQTLVLGTHQDLAHLSHRKVRTVRLCGVDERRVAKMVRARIEHARRGPGRVPTIPTAVLAQFMARFGGNRSRVRVAVLLIAASNGVYARWPETPCAT